MKLTKSRLVIGYGNREKSDEGAGCRIAEIIQQQDWKDTEALSVEYLTPRLASFMIQAKTVVFVGSYVPFNNLKPEIIVKHFLPNSKKEKFEINSLDPPSVLLSFTQLTYHKQPNAFWILIPAVNCQKGNNFSSSTQEAIQNAITYLAAQKPMDIIPSDHSVNRSSKISLSSPKIGGQKMDAIQLLSRKEQGERIFSKANLHGANLKGINLEEIDLSEADLSHADLTEAQLSRSNLSSANLTDADLDYADLRSANLSQVNLIGASLVGAKLGRANLKGADVRGADFSDADLSGAILTDVELSAALLTGANIGDVELQQVATERGISHKWISWSGS